jgi:hypothetical protein
MHHIIFYEDEMEGISKVNQNALDDKHPWYADFKNKKTHYIIFKDRIFVIPRNQKETYQEAVDYGLSLGLPINQLDFNRLNFLEKLFNLFS